MRRFETLPLAPLLPYVDRIWGWEADAGENIILPTVPPGTGAELFFHSGRPFCYADPVGHARRFDAMHLLCVRHKPIALLPTKNVRFIAVRFRVGMLHRFINAKPDVVIDKARSVEDLWPGAGSELRRSMSASPALSRQLALIQDFLLGKLSTEGSDELVERALMTLYREPAIRVDALAARFAIGRRQLERRFRSLIGQTPVELRGLIRFQKTARRLVLDAECRALDVALQYGYYDEAQFLNDFRTRVRTTPAAFRRTARMTTHFYNPPR